MEPSYKEKIKQRFEKILKDSESNDKLRVGCLDVGSKLRRGRCIIFDKFFKMNKLYFQIRFIKLMIGILNRKE